MHSGVEQYLAGLPENQRVALEQLRRTITSVVPDVEETIRVGVPAFRYRGKPLVSIGAAKRHVALYIMYGTVLHEHAGQLRAHETSNTVVRFRPGRPLPTLLVAELVRARMLEIEGAPRVPDRRWDPARSDRRRLSPSTEVRRS